MVKKKTADFFDPAQPSKIKIQSSRPYKKKTKPTTLNYKILGLVEPHTYHAQSEASEETRPSFYNSEKKTCATPPPRLHDNM